MLILGGVPSLKKTAKAPENGWLEDEFPFGKPYLQGQAVSFREGIRLLIKTHRCKGCFFCAVNIPPLKGNCFQIRQFKDSFC